MKLRGTKCRSNLKKRDSSLMLGMTALEHKAGFTLLELMISVTILGILVLLVGSAMRLSYRSVESGEKQMEMLERMRASIAIMDKQIQSVIPRMEIRDGNPGYFFMGNKKSMQFSTNYSLWGSRKGYVTVTYRIRSDSNGLESLYAEETMIGLDNMKETKLLAGYRDIYFEYFRTYPAEEGTKWLEEWDDDFFIPEKIRLHMYDGNRRFSMLIPLRARERGF